MHYSDRVGTELRGDRRRSELLGEAGKRLQQVGMLLTSIEALEAEFESDAREGQARLQAASHLLHRPHPTVEDKMRFLEMTGAAKKPDFRRWDEIILYVECFYYIAFRCCRVLEQLPGLEKLKYKGITLVRNKLIEHADKGDSTVLSNSVGWSPGPGVRLRGIRQDWDSKDFPDNGLRANLCEFSDSLSMLLAPNQRLHADTPARDRKR